MPKECKVRDRASRNNPTKGLFAGLCSQLTPFANKSASAVSIRATLPFASLANNVTSTTTKDDSSSLTLPQTIGLFSELIPFAKKSSSSITSGASLPFASLNRAKISATKDDSSSSTRTKSALAGVNNVPAKTIKRLQRSKTEGHKIDSDLDFLRAEFDRAPPEEQEQVHRELYGCNAEIAILERDPDFVTEKLKQFNHALESLKKKEAYEVAMMECAEEVNDPSFRLRFLRADLFQPKKAARRFVKYWDGKVDVWGVERAFKGKIQLNDLCADALAFLDRRAIRQLGSDENGRGLIWHRFQDYGPITKTGMGQAVWWILEQMTQEEEFQKKGFVIVSWIMGNFTLTDWDRTRAQRILDLLLKAFPVRVVGFHHCFNDMKIRGILPVFLMFLGKQTRLRYRFHTGKASDCLTTLSEYGISGDKLPVDSTGKISYEGYSTWFGRLKNALDDQEQHQQVCEEEPMASVQKIDLQDVLNTD